jgi:hypothetical protein
MRPIRPFRAFLFGFLQFLGAKCPLRPIFPLRFFLIATLLQHLTDSTCMKVESFNKKSGTVTARSDLAMELV